MIYLDDLIRAGAEVMQRGTSQEWRGFAYDSRLAQTDDLFVALQTERADGHLFIKEALAAGVSGIVCSHSSAPAPLLPVLSFHTEVAQVHDVPANTPISYGGTFITTRASRIATIQGERRKKEKGKRFNAEAQKPQRRRFKSMLFSVFFTLNAALVRYEK